MLTRRSACYLALALSVPFGKSVAETDSSAWVEQLNNLAKHIGQVVPKESVDTIVATPASAHPEVRAMRAALLYRVDQTQWESELTATFTVQDYAERARGKVTNIGQDEVISKIKAVESSYPSMSPQVVMLAAFVRYRDANLWFARGDQRISLARFLRGAFLAQVFKGSNLDPVAVANQLDERAKREYEHQLKAK